MKHRLAVTLAVTAGLAVSAAAGLASSARRGSTVASRPIAGVAMKKAPVTTTTPPPAVVDPPKGTILLATITKPTPDYSAPFTKGSPKPAGIVPIRWHSSVVSLPVIGQKPGWLDVRLPQRPNGLTAWIRSTAPTLSYTGYSIVINVTTMHLSLYLRGIRIMYAPAGVGTPLLPTPTGNFFIAYFAQPPSSGYGPFVIVTSAHSNFITDWEASGDAEIGIHGPLGMDVAIGTTGARVSHGCVRLHVSDLAQLRDVPLGTPVTIIT